jgi:hypothetical protein
MATKERDVSALDVKMPSSVLSLLSWDRNGIFDPGAGVLLLSWV